MRVTTASRNARSCDATRTAPSRRDEVCLEPLQRGEVEMVGGLVEQQQVGVVHEQAGEGDPGLLTARQAGRWALPVLLRHAEAGQRLLHPLVEVIAVEVVEALAQPGVLAGWRPRPAPACSRRVELVLEALGLRRARAHGPQDGRLVRERPGRGCDSWPSMPTRTPCAVWALPASGSSWPTRMRSRVVLPAPLGPTSPTRSPRAMEPLTESRMTNVPISRRTPSRRRMLTEGRRRRA